MKHLVLCIMDGVGIRTEEHGNAVTSAKTPNLDKLYEMYPHSLLEASGRQVGLPKGQMGNSEVGHSNIGAGRIVHQSLNIISDDIESGKFFDNTNILEVMNHTKINNSKLHIMGMISDGGIHSHIDHLFALVDMCVRENINNVYFHLFTDGRDTLERASYSFISQLEEKLKDAKVGVIASIGGRYYGMDRNDNWDRVKKHYDVMVYGIGEQYNSPKEVIESNYKKDITDEFIVPAILNNNGVIESNDGIIVFNFRPDRLREILTSLTNDKFNSFEHKNLFNIKLVTMMPVADTVIGQSAFQLQEFNNLLGDYISKKGLKQLRIAETEKYAHVTYFFDGGVDKEIPNCDRILIPSPDVATYDLRPEMSAYEITNKLIEVVDNYDVVILNFANGDMVGHTGDLNAAIKAVSVVDECVGALYEKVSSIGGTLIVTADHGNCEYMLDDDNNVITSHTTSLVPFIVTNKQIKLKDGKLGDIAPTMLQLLDLDIPDDMTGKSLIVD